MKVLTSSFLFLEDHDKKKLHIFLMLNCWHVLTLNCFRLTQVDSLLPHKNFFTGGDLSNKDKFSSVRPNPDRPQWPKTFLMNTDLDFQTHNSQSLNYKLEIHHQGFNQQLFICGRWTLHLFFIDGGSQFHVSPQQMA